MGNFGSSVLLAGALTASAGVQAQAIAITNPSFEANFAPAGGFPVLVPNGWNLYDPGGIVNQANNAVGVLNPTGTSFFTAPVPDGNNVALVYLEQRRGTVLPGDPVGLSQILGATLQINTAYTLTVGIGNIASGSGLGAFAGFGFADLSGFPGYRIELLAGGQVIAADNNSLGGGIAEGQFETATVQTSIGASNALAGQALGIRIINLNATGNLVERAREVDFDNVRLIAAAVPEPHTYALFAAGFGLILMIRRARASRSGDLT